MRFLPSTEQRDFASGLDALLTAADAPAAIRALAVPERFGGTDLLSLELALACVELGRHAVPGPLAASFAASVLLDGTPQAPGLLPRVIAGEAVNSLALPGHSPYAAARAALQLHGAIGYTDEFDLSLWIRRARVLRTAWGSPSDCRRLLLDTRKGTTGRLVR
jgi:alkylation response protein AidB-like acyl-CoA dehydrogenase